MTWFEFWKRYDGFMRDKAFQFAMTTNPHLKEPRRFESIYDETYGAIGIRKPPSSTKETFAFKAKQFGLKLPDGLKK